MGTGEGKKKASVIITRNIGGTYMELQIFNPAEDDFLRVIEWNHEEIKQEVAQKVEQYKNLVYTDREIKEAKIDRANLNKFIAALESKRKEVKKKCLEPYETFEKQMKEIIAIVKEPVRLIDKQIEEVEETKRAEKKAKILEYYEQTIKELRGILPFEKVFKPSYLHTGKSLKSIEKEIKETIEQVGKDIETIEANVEPKKRKEESQVIIKEKKYVVGLEMSGTKEQLDLFCKFLNKNQISYVVTQKPQLKEEYEWEYKIH